MAKDSYNDTSTAVVPAKLGSIGGGVASEKNPSARGTPEIQKSDGMANLRVSAKTLEAAGPSKVQGSKGNAPVTRYNDDVV